jgi:2-polyprenyl-3-methyl-5-hydroxy-6-metoxy-1,4-benzoquinol methylase
MWDERYQAQTYYFGITPNVSLVRLSHWLKPRGRVLCVAEGEGRNAVWLASQGFEVTAFDSSKCGRDKALRLATQRQVSIEYTFASITDHPWSKACFDAVVAIFIQFATPEERTALFDNMLCSLKPGGRLILVGYTPRQLDYRSGGPSNTDQLYTAALCRDAFLAERILHLEEHLEVLVEGEGHRGLSAFIECVVEKNN